ncbi:MAG: DUF2630 family protein [Acidimicrobiales bacterium]
MDDSEIHGRINELVRDEHRLRSLGSSLGEEERAKLRSLEASLDQCWDLLRQRQARRNAGLDPNDAQARDTETIGHYRQ